MKNQDVVRSFAWGKRAAAGNLHTDGRSLWSYDLKIAQRTPEGVVVREAKNIMCKVIAIMTSNNSLAKNNYSQLVYWWAAFATTYDCR